jgi:hypothetical protein
VKDYVGEGMDYALKHYNESKFREALDTVQKEVLYSAASLENLI